MDHQLRWNLISDKIVRDNGIEVTREEINAFTKAKVLAYFGMEEGDEEDAPWLDGYVDKMGKDTKTINDTYQTMMTDKLFAFLRTQFAMQEETIAEEDFFKLPAPGAAHHHG